MLKEGTPSKSFYEASITLISKPDKEIKKKKNLIRKLQKKEVNRPISCMNMDTEVLNQTLSHQVKLVVV